VPGRPSSLPGIFFEQEMRQMKWILAATAALAMAQPAVPRPAPEFQIVEASGNGTKLSSLRGDVVLLAFVVTTCPHCQAASRQFEKLKAEFGSRGLRVAEAAFDDNGDVSGYVRRLALTFPVGRSNRTDVRAFLGVGQDVRIGTPQVVLIDRGGMIRAQSAPEGTPMLQSADVVRGLIDAMLRRNPAL
jgi:peroxiredoxin